MNSTLREIVESDLSLVLEWRNAEDVRANMYTNHVITVDEHRSWWESQRNNPRTRLLIFEIDGLAVGVITFTNFTGPGGTASWAFYSGDRSRRGIGAAMEIAALNYAFDTLQVRRLECEVLEFNRGVIRFHRRHGFRVEGILREGYVRDGKPYDIYRLAMLAREWRNFKTSSSEDKATGANDYAGRKFTRSVIVDSALVEQFADAINEHKPSSFNDGPGTIVGLNTKNGHGMLAGSLFLDFFASEFPGPGTIYLGQTLEFYSPIAVGTTVNLRMHVLSHIGRQLFIDTQVFVGDFLCISGQADLLIPISLNEKAMN